MNWKVVLMMGASLGWTANVTAATCNADAELAAQMAKEANKNNRLEEAVKFYRNAATACGRFEDWISAADILATYPLSGPEYTESGAQDKAAVDAYVQAYRVAGDEEQFARAAMGIAGAAKGDPINARKWVINAREWGASGADFAELEARVERAGAQLSKAEFEASLATRGPGKAGSILYSVDEIRPPPRGVTPLQVAEAGGGGGGGGGLPVKPKPDKVPSIDIPLNFVTASTTLDSLTADNVETLAEVLAENFGNQSIMFIGHADVRGDPDMNRWLSLKRARAVRETVEGLQPGLRGQIDVDGRGADEPLDPGNSEAAYRTNRRLQVIIVK